MARRPTATQSKSSRRSARIDADGGETATRRRCRGGSRDAATASGSCRGAAKSSVERDRGRVAVAPDARTPRRVDGGRNGDAGRSRLATAPRNRRPATQTRGDNSRSAIAAEQCRRRVDGERRRQRRRVDAASRRKGDARSARRRQATAADADGGEAGNDRSRRRAGRGHRATQARRRRRDDRRSAEQTDESPADAICNRRRSASRRAKPRRGVGRRRRGPRRSTRSAPRCAVTTAAVDAAIASAQSTSDAAPTHRRRSERRRGDRRQRRLRRPTQPARGRDARAACRAIDRFTRRRATPTTTAGGVDRARFVGRVEGAIRAAHQRDGRVQVRLSPPELGSLRIELTVQHGVLSAQARSRDAGRAESAARQPAGAARSARPAGHARRAVRRRRAAGDGGGGVAAEPTHDRPAREPAWRPGRRGRSRTRLPRRRAPARRARRRRARRGARRARVATRGSSATCKSSTNDKHGQRPSPSPSLQGRRRTTSWQFPDVNSELQLRASTTSRSKSGGINDVNIDDFLKIMITELQNQDPLNPLENDELIAQISQIRSVGATEKLTETLDSVLLGQNISSATNLIGAEIDAISDDNQRVTGVVERVSVASGQPKLHLDLNPRAKLSDEAGDIEAGRVRVPRGVDADKATLFGVDPLAKVDGQDDRRSTDDGGAVQLSNLPVTHGRQARVPPRSGREDFQLVGSITDGKNATFLDTVANGGSVGPGARRHAADDGPVAQLHGEPEERRRDSPAGGRRRRRRRPMTPTSDAGPQTDRPASDRVRDRTDPGSATSMHEQRSDSAINRTANLQERRYDHGSANDHDHVAHRHDGRGDDDRRRRQQRRQRQHGRLQGIERQLRHAVSADAEHRLGARPTAAAAPTRGRSASA